MSILCHPFFHFIRALESGISTGVLWCLRILSDRMSWITRALGSVVRGTWQDRVTHLNEVLWPLPLPCSSCLCPPPAVNYKHDFGFVYFYSCIDWVVVIPKLSCFPCTWWPFGCGAPAYLMAALQTVVWWKDVFQFRLFTVFFPPLLHPLPPLPASPTCTVRCQSEPGTYPLPPSPVLPRTRMARAHTARISHTRHLATRYFSLVVLPLGPVTTNIVFSDVSAHQFV